MPPASGVGRGRRIRRRIVVAASVCFACGLALAASPNLGMFASFSAETENAKSDVAGGWVEAAKPTGITVAGYGASLAWMPGTTGVVGQELRGADGGTNPAAAACPVTNMVNAWPLMAAMASASTSSYSDVGSAAENGHWFCYQMVGTHGLWWTPAPFDPIRVGLYPVSVALSGNGSGKLDNGEQIIVTFNQPVNTPTIGNGICQVKNGPLIVGFTGTCSGTSTPRVGTVSGLNVGKTGTTPASVSVAGAVVTVTATNGGQNISGSGTFTASASVTSSIGAAQACTAAFCQLTVASGF